MSITAAAPVDLDTLHNTLRQHTGKAGPVTITGDPAQPGAILTSTVWTDAELGAALSAPVPIVAPPHVATVRQLLGAAQAGTLTAPQVQQLLAAVANILTGNP